MSVRDNIVLPHLQHFARIGGTINRRALDAAVAPLMARLGIRPDNPALAAGSLSGGNQQKLLFARWMMGTTHTLLLDEATHGVDIGAKALIKSQIREFAARGGAVLMHSVEIEDLAELVDELYLMIGNKLSAPQQRPPSGYDLAGLKGQMSLIDPTITHAEHAQ
jgi:ABC-type sugar transport system ATPase subunit